MFATPGRGEKSKMTRTRSAAADGARTRHSIGKRSWRGGEKSLGVGDWGLGIRDKGSGGVGAIYNKPDPASKGCLRQRVGPPSRLSGVFKDCRPT